MATPASGNTADVGRIEHEIAQVRDDVGRTVQEMGSRADAGAPHGAGEAQPEGHDHGHDPRRGAVGDRRRRATSRSRTRDAALDARDRVQAHPYAAGAIGAGIGARLLAGVDVDAQSAASDSAGVGRAVRSLEPAPARHEAAVLADDAVRCRSPPARGGGVHALAHPRSSRCVCAPNKRRAPRAVGAPASLTSTTSAYEVGFFAPIVFDSSCTCCRWSFSVGSVLAANALMSRSPDAVGHLLERLHVLLRGRRPSRRRRRLSNAAPLSFSSLRMDRARAPSLSASTIFLLRGDLLQVGIGRAVVLLELGRERLDVGVLGLLLRQLGDGDLGHAAIGGLLDERRHRPPARRRPGSLGRPRCGAGSCMAGGGVGSRAARAAASAAAPSR